MGNIIGVVDEPVAPGSIDNLDIDIHTKSLIKFTEHTSTPITIGIQGEWGSGKTSLLNSIKHHFEQDASIKQIWINSWEYSLLSTPEEALLKIVNRIIEELLDADTNEARKDKIRRGTKNLIRGALRLGTHLALGEDAANAAGELLSGSEASIGALRGQLSELSQEIKKRESNPYKKIIIYVDDLDRIEPKNAVALLELLKNIFSIPNCVFVLAIDYQVVVKGLEHKFGKQTTENEWEFRAFFDKIIQLPFMMPMGQYNIGKYVNKLLTSIGFVDEQGLDEDAIREIISRTISGNPRSIKRLVNSIALIKIFSAEKAGLDTLDQSGMDSDEDEALSESDGQLLLFSLLCLQISYPSIYNLLIKEPNFMLWDKELAHKETNRAEEDSEGIFEYNFNRAKQTQDFDEEWEQALYRICYVNPRLKRRAIDISKFFSYIKDDFLAEKQEDMGMLIAGVLSETSVTNINSTDQGNIILPENERSKLLDTSQMELLTGFSLKLFPELAKAGSVVFASNRRKDNITGWIRMKRKGGRQNILWIICFHGYLRIRIIDDFSLYKFLESKRAFIEETLPGFWVFDGKEERKNNFISFPSPYYDKKNKSSANQFAALSEDDREKSLAWLKDNTPQFEKLMISLIDEFNN